MPADYIRKQTIAGGERYITPALKEYEDKVLGADERIAARELELFEALRHARRRPRRARILDTARAVATLDVLAALADAAAACNYTKPFVHDGDEFQATDARHPIVERHVSGAFVPNDVHLDATTRQVMILTGPEHGRQVHVPAAGRAARAAGAGRVVRAGAHAPSSRSSIASSRASARPTTSRAASRRSWSRCRRPRRSCTRRPSRSLVILDEIGRGTATFDGLSLAWAVAEHLASNAARAPEDDLRDALPRAHRSRRRAAGVVNFHVAAREFSDDIVFLHKIVAGRSDRSYGIQVARLAGLPPAGRPPRGGDPASRSSRTSCSAAAGPA